MSISGVLAELLYVFQYHSSDGERVEDSMDVKGFAKSKAVARTTSLSWTDHDLESGVFNAIVVKDKE